MQCMVCEVTDKETDIFTIKIVKNGGTYFQTVDSMDVCESCLKRNVLKSVEEKSNED